MPVSVLLFLLAQIKSKGLSLSSHNPNSISVTICEQRTIRKMCKQMIWLGVRMWKCVWVCLHSHVKVSILLSHVCLLACDCSLFPLMAFPYFKRCFASKFSEYSEAKIAQFKGMPFISIANIFCAFFFVWLCLKKETNAKQRMFF